MNTVCEHLTWRGMHEGVRKREHMSEPAEWEGGREW